MRELAAGAGEERCVRAGLHKGRPANGRGSLGFAWPFPRDFQSSTRYRLKSRCILAATGFISKFWLTWLNRFRSFNGESFQRHLEMSKPVITVSNHTSCLDDPMLWGMLSWRQLWEGRRIRWCPSAHDIVFTSEFPRRFFPLGRCVPVIRGEGVYQRGVDFCIDRLNEGAWVHIFPEGKVNMTGERMRFKWGVGRMVADSLVAPTVIPFWHVGFDKIFPNERRFLRVGQKATVLFGEPLCFDSLLLQLKEANANARETRKAITDVIQATLHKLEIDCIETHNSYWR